MGSLYSSPVSTTLKNVNYLKIGWNFVFNILFFGIAFQLTGSGEDTKNYPTVSHDEKSWLSVFYILLHIISTAKNLAAAAENAFTNSF